MDNVLSDIPYVCVYLDDILVTGKTEAEHLHNLNKVLQRLQSSGLTLKKDKCKFMVTAVEYLGHIIDANGLHPSEKKVKAIKEAPTPSNVTEFKSFLGLLNYYHKFLPDIATTLAPLHSLLTKSAKWVWSQPQQEAFTKAKSLLHSSSLLVHYDDKKPILLSCDASNYGLGAVLSHRMDDNSEKPIAFASRTLSPAEKKYAQLEKEALAIIFAVKKFHDYLYGRHFTLYSDHKPLQYLLNESKQIPVLASSRIQHWALTLSAYTYSICYKPGNKLAHADALSRLPLPDHPKVVPMPHDVTLLLHHLSESIVHASSIKDWTDKDPILSRVRTLVQTGWSLPDDTPELQPYAQCYTELSVIDGCLLRGSRVIVPLQGRPIILSQLHDTHPGISRMKSLARSYVWWPGLDRDIENTVKSCHTCQESRPAPPQAPVHPWECPSHPWARLHIDHAGPFLGKTFLIVVDAHSRWLEVCVVDSTSAEATIRSLRTIFATHGLPEQVVSDNGPAFISHDFKEFMQKNGIPHSLVSPYHPRSNGLAERAVQTFKTAMKKLEGPIHVRISRFLLQYRVTPQTTTGQSPSELLTGRRLRIALDLVHPDIAKKVEVKQNKVPQPQQCVRSHTIGDRLYARNFSGSPTWIPVVVTKVTGPVSYHVETEQGITIRRHIDQLRPRATDPPTLDNTDDFDDFPIPSNTIPLDPPFPMVPDPPDPPLRRLNRHRTLVDTGPFVR